jgi:serine/threonine-protein kinase
MPEWNVPGYTELKALGSGGFGEVMLARHDASGVLVAIKYLRHDLLADPGFTGMFRGEAAVLASLEDPNIVRLYEYVESPAGAAIVMELISGVSLHEILVHQGSTAPEAALVVLQGSLLGLAAAHQRGVVHRDYKPDNVLVNGDGLSKLTDFGLAVRTGDRPAPAGTLTYVAPEQIAGAPASPAGDVYSATATFYQCLTGRPPFSGETAELLRQHRTKPVPLDPVPAPLRPLVAAGMAKDPQHRPADAITFITELQTVASGAYGKDWEKRGRSHLGEAALLLTALWPSGAPPAAQGTTVHRISLRHIAPVKAAIAAGAAVIVVAAGTALAANQSHAPRLPSHAAAAVHPVTLQPATSMSPTPSTSSTSAPPSASSTSGPPSASSTSGPPSASSTSAPPSASSTSALPPKPSAPQITSVQTYANGVLVYFSIHYADPGHDAEGFGFVGINGSGWAEEQHPFSSPSYGIVGPDSIAYPFNLECGTSSQVSQSYVEAWIYDTAGVRSRPVVIQLDCTS